MKVAIVGSRSYKPLDNVGFFVRQLDRDIIIVSGGAKGVDSEAERAAIQSNKGVEIYPVNAPDDATKQEFAVLAKQRNQEIVDASDIVVAFWNGFSTGTADTIGKTRVAGKPVRIIDQKVTQQDILAHAQEINRLLESEKNPKVVIYSDGACFPNPGNGGIGIVLLMPEKKARREISQSIGKATNQIAEIVAATTALEALKRPCDVTLYSDSQYLIRTMNGEYKRKTNIEYWEQLDKAVSRHNVQWEWIRGHNGDPENERADTLANQAARKQSSTTPR